jgi:cell division protein FtsA
MKGKASNFVAFDIGTSKIAALAASVTKQGEANVVSQILHHSQGFKSGVITDLESAENSIIGAIYSLEKECDKSIKEVTISLSGVGVKSYYLNRSIKLGSQAVTKQDVKKLLTKVLAEFKVKDMEIIHYFPIEFILDNQNIVENPTGMFGRELQCHIHAIAANSIMLMNLSNCFARCHIEVTDVMLSIYSSGIAVLRDEEMELGSIIIDLGSNTSSFAVFFAGKIVYVGHVPIGSSHITSDIAKVFSLSIETSEKLKILYGNAVLESLNKDEIIRIEQISPDHDYDSDITITSGKLNEVIHPRIEEIMLMILKQYNMAGVDHLIARRVIITGGGSCLQGVKNLAARIFQKQVRIAKPENLPGFAENFNPYMYSTAVGMIKSKSIKCKKDYGFNGDNESQGWLKKTFTWIRENI